MNNKDDLQDDVDPKLQQLYRQLPKEQPSAELDAKILAAAKNTTPKKRHHWQAPFALAASVVMVSSVVLYLHEENPTAFEASAPTTQAPVASEPKPAANITPEPSPAAAMAKPAANNTANDVTKIHEIANTKTLADQKITSLKAKDATTSTLDEAQTASADVSMLDEKKSETVRRADQMADQFSEKAAANRSIQSAVIAKEQETRQAQIETDKLAAAAPGPAPIIAPAPQMQRQAEVAKPRSFQADRLQDSNRANRQLSAVSSESDKPAILEKSNYAAGLAAAPMAAAPAPMAAGSLSGAAMPMPKQHVKRDEADASTDYAKNMSAPILSIEGVAMGMSREQLVAQGLMCYVDVCHLDLSQTQQETYWGMPAHNAHLTAFLSRQVVTKLVLQQKNAQLNQVKTALSKVGIASQQSCIEEKGTLLISRQLGANFFNVRSMGVGLSLAICQQTKP